MTDYSSAPPPPEGQGQTPGHTSGPTSGPASGQGAYPPAMPGYEAPAARGPVAQPASIALAVKLMYAGAALALLGILITLLSRDTIRETVEKASRDASTPMTSTEMDAAVALGVGVGVVSGLVGVALWLWMAAANGRGRKWARVVATVFFALSVIFTLLSLLQSPPVLSLVLSLVSLLLGAYIIMLLYKRESTEYYEAQSAPKY